MSGQGRKCVFCEERAESKEHVIPAWVHQCFEGETLHHYTIRDNKTERNWSSKRPDFQARIVCIQCNTGWMHDLEETTRPILQPMIFGHGTQLRPSHQRILSLWIAKTALVMAAGRDVECAEQFGPAYESMYKHHDAPIAMWRIRLGTFGPSRMWVSSDVIPSALRIEMDGEAVGAPYLEATIHIGHFVAFAQCFHPSLLGHEKILQKRSGLYPFWPSIGPRVMWPMGPYLTEAFAQRARKRAAEMAKSMD